jgi:hypothetical protein
MTTALLLGALVLLLVPLVVSIRRATELFVIRVRDGRAHFTRGRIPQSLLDEIDDVVGAPVVPDALLRVVRRSGKPELSCHGSVHPDQQQRLRNVIGRYSVQRIAAGGRPRR